MSRGAPKVPLTRKLRRRGHSLAVVLPADLVAMLGWTETDEIQFETIGSDQVLLRRRSRPPDTR